MTTVPHRAMAGRVVIVSGWPGSGKSTVAALLADDMAATVVSHDWLLSALRENDELWEQIGEPWSRIREIGWVLMGRVVEQQLQIGRSCVLDLVARAAAVDVFRTIADRYGAEVDIIECTCSDENLHRGRIEGRLRDIPGWPELTWPQVVGSRAAYEPLAGRVCALDAVATVEANMARVRLFLDVERRRHLGAGQ